MLGWVTLCLVCG